MSRCNSAVTEVGGARVDRLHRFLPVLLGLGGLAAAARLEAQPAKTPERPATSDDVSIQLSETWYSEVMKGRIETAATRYERIYRVPPSARASAADRVMAAFRAGVCFELLGEERRDRAVMAYTWLDAWQRRNDRLDDGLRDLALLRLNALERPAPAGGAVYSAADAVETLEKLVDTRLQLVARFRERVDEYLLEKRARASLLESLVLAGLSPASGAPSRRAAADALDAALGQLLDLEPSVQSLLVDSAADRFLEDAMRGVIRGDFGVAAASLSSALLLAPEHREARSFGRFRQLAGAGGAPGFAAEFAQVRFDGFRAVRLAQLRQKLTAAIAAAAKLERRDRAVRALEAARQLLHWGPDHVFSDPEIRALERGLRVRYLVRAGGGEAENATLRNLWRRSAAQARDLLGLVVEYVSLFQEMEAAREPPVSSTSASTRAIVSRELQRLTVLLNEQVAADRNAEAAVARRKIALLKEWFP